MILIPDYGSGNLASILRMLQYCNIEAMIINSPKELRKASKIILAGVGSFDFAMDSLIKNNWKEELDEFVLVKKKPILGICLGMQLMCSSSEEGKLSGLNWVDTKVSRFSNEISTNFKIPHMGWNLVNIVKDNLLFKSNFEYQKFYFVHSYHVSTEYNHKASTLTQYGYDFPSAFEKDNIFGVQFHPEKSHKYGMNLLTNFSKSI